MEVALDQQLLLDPSAHAIAEQDAVRHHDPAAAAVLEQTNHQLKEEPRGLRCLLIGWEVGLDSPLLFSAERRICEDDVNAVAPADLGNRPRERIGADNIRLGDLVQDEVHHSE